jgi:hypothetical protein
VVSKKKQHVPRDGAAAGAGIAALALLSRLIEMLVTNKKLSSRELHEALDDALLSLEKGQADSPVPEASICARHCLEQLLDRQQPPPDELLKPRARKPVR